MADISEEREIRQLNRTLEMQGLEGNFDLTDRRNKRQWYKADGTPIPGLLPTDDYNRRKLEASGLTLVPPASPRTIAPGLSPIEQEVMRARAQAVTKGAGTSPVEVEVARERDNHEKDVQARALATVVAAVPPPAVPDSVADTAPAAPIGHTAPCAEPGCTYVAEGQTTREAARRLERHTYGWFSKHHKEKSNG